MKNNKEFSAEMKRRIYKLVNDILMIAKEIDWKAVCLGNARAQLANACTSVGANYIEAIGTATPKDFSRFLGHALRSANETQYWLLLIHDLSVSHKSRIKVLLDETMQISKILATSIKTIRRQNSPKKRAIFD